MAGIFESYKSPITMNISFEQEKLISEADRCLCTAVMKVSDIRVNEEELKKALEYDSTL